MVKGLRKPPTKDEVMKSREKKYVEMTDRLRLAQKNIEQVITTENKVHTSVMEYHTFYEIKTLLASMVLDRETGQKNPNIMAVHSCGLRLTEIGELSRAEAGRQTVVERLPGTVKMDHDIDIVVKRHVERYRNDWFELVEKPKKANEDGALGISEEVMRSLFIRCRLHGLVPVVKSVYVKDDVAVMRFEMEPAVVKTA